MSEGITLSLARDILGKKRGVIEVRYGNSMRTYPILSNAFNPHHVLRHINTYMVWYKMEGKGVS